MFTDMLRVSTDVTSNNSRYSHLIFSSHFHRTNTRLDTTLGDFQQQKVRPDPIQKFGAYHANC